MFVTSLPLRHMAKLSYQGHTRKSHINRIFWNHLSWLWFFLAHFFWQSFCLVMTLLRPHFCGFWKLPITYSVPDLGQDPRKSFSLHINNRGIFCVQTHFTSLAPILHPHSHTQKKSESWKFESISKCLLNFLLYTFKRQMVYKKHTQPGARLSGF